MRYWDDYSVTQLLVRRMGHLKKETIRVVCVGLPFLGPKTVPTVPCIGHTPCFRSNCVFREVTPASHGNLKTDRADYRERKRFHAELTLLKVIASSTKGFLGILSDVPVAQERSLSFTYGRPEESCSSFTLIYFGKRRASRKNLFWSC